MIRFRKVGEFKFFLYISDAKLEMLYQQIASGRKNKKSMEWGVDLKVVNLAQKTERDADSSRNDKLKVILQAMEDVGLVGTIDTPKEYIKGSLPMKWGMLQDWGRPTEEPPLVYFGGRTQNTVFGLGGSSRHVIGVYGASATGSRSVTPSLVGQLLDGLNKSREGWRTCPKFEGDDNYDTYVAIGLATDKLNGPEQNMEFYAKTLLTGEFKHKQEKMTKVLLASPLYVALTHPLADDTRNY
jgi:hypothetical protein